MMALDVKYSIRLCHYIYRLLKCASVLTKAIGDSGVRGLRLDRSWPSGRTQDGEDGNNVSAGKHNQNYIIAGEYIFCQHYQLIVYLFISRRFFALRL